MDRSADGLRSLPGPRHVDAWLVESARWLERFESLINHINVFPVADRDTGSNLLATVRACVEPLASAVARASSADDGGLAPDRAPSQAPEPARAPAAPAPTDPETWGSRLQIAAQAAGRRALGNSGTVLVVLLASLAHHLEGVRRLDAPSWSAAVTAAEVRAASAVSERAPASVFDILTAMAAVPAPEGGSVRSLLSLVEAQADAARRAVAATLNGSEALARFGVIDAGAAGLLVVIEALRSVLTGEPFREDAVRSLPGLETSEQSVVEARGSSCPTGGESGVEVVCTVVATPLDMAMARAALDEAAESVMVSPLDRADAAGMDPLLWRVHAHADAPETILDIVAEAGAPGDVTISSLEDPER